MDQALDSAVLHIRAPLSVSASALTSAAAAKTNATHGARSATDFFNGLAHHTVARRHSNDIAARLRDECRHIQQERAAALLKDAQSEAAQQN